MERICQVGPSSEKYRYEDLRLECKGFLNVLSFHVDDQDYRQELMEKGDAVVILPVDFAGRHIYMIEQRRHLRAFTETSEGKASLAKVMAGGASEPFEVRPETIRHFELPAGMIDKGEDPAHAAARELAEETGLIVAPSALEQVAHYYPSLGSTTEMMTAFIARLPDPVVKNVAHGDGDEQIVVWRMTWDEAFGLLDSGKIITGSSAVLLRELRIIDLRSAR
jgi:8-oxo-dGTP pyrophosphatase MutT (NUDIX family)